MKKQRMVVLTNQLLVSNQDPVGYNRTYLRVVKTNTSRTVSTEEFIGWMRSPSSYGILKERVSQIANQNQNKRLRPKDKAPY